jgi:hypothetical protein
MKRSTHRPLQALATAILAGAAALLLLPLSGPAGAAEGDASCGFDPARPSMCRFELAGGIVLESDSSNVRVHEDGVGFDVVGDVEIPTAGEPVVLGEAIVVFSMKPGGGRAFTYGTALMPFPRQGFLSAIEVSRQPMVSFGVRPGSEIGFTGAPVHPDRHYLYFYGNTILEAGYGAISMTTPGGTLSAVLDPSDPYFYIAGELIGLGGNDPEQEEGDDSEQAGEGDDSEAEEAEEGDGASLSAFAFSLHGQIPFTPLVTRGVEEYLPEFDGHVYVRGDIPLHAFLSLSGDTVFDIDPDMDGDHPFEPTFYDGSSRPDLAIGGNGTLAVGVPFLRFFEFGFDLGHATAVGMVSDLQPTQVVFSGEIGVDQSDIFGALPVSLGFPDPFALYGAYTESELGSFLHGEGALGLDPSAIGALFGVELGPISSSEAVMDVNSLGLTVQGRTSTSPLPALGFAEASVIAHVSPDGLDSYLAIEGDLRIDTFELRGGRFEAHLSNGVSVAGEVQISNTVFGMTGQFAPAGYTLTGEAMLADAVAVNASQTLELTNALLQNEQSRAALEDALAAANATLQGSLAAVNAAQAAVSLAQKEVNSLQSSINTQVSYRNSNYNSYRSWVNKSCKWYDAPCHATRAANISYYWGRYSYHVGVLATLSAAKSVADAALAMARNTLVTAQAGLAGAQAGVALLQSQLDALAAQIAALQAQLDALPDIEGELRPIVTATIDNGRLVGTVRAEWNGMQISEGRVSFASPAEACVTIPVPGVGELCSPL